MSLVFYNQLACGVHLALAIFFAAYFSYINTAYPNNSEQGIELSIRDHVLIFTSDANHTITTSWGSNEMVRPPVQFVQNLLIGFFLLTAGFHLFYATTSSYAGMISSHNNYVRWIEYAITSTMMLYIISLLVGVKDVNVYIMLGVSNVVMMAQGQAIEEAIRDGRSPLIPMLSGFALLLVEFFVISRDYLNRMNQASTFGKANPWASLQQIPSWVSYMIIILFVFFSCFGLICLYSSYQGNAYDYENIETMYIVLSLVAKATLGIFLAYGSTIRQQIAS